MSDIILFDGICNLCDTSVQFIVRHDPRQRFKFASLQSDVGQRLLYQHSISREVDSIVLIHRDKAYVESTAALKVCHALNMPWKMMYPLRLVPRPIRDWLYRIVAGNRYHWFGKKHACSLPSVGDQSRFL